MEQIIADLISKASSLVTVDSIIIIGVIFGLTQFAKQFYKSKAGRKSPRWVTRGVALLVGMGATILLLDMPLKHEVVYGLFYGGMSPLVFFLVKKKIIKKKARP